MKKTTKPAAVLSPLQLKRVKSKSAIFARDVRAYKLAEARAKASQQDYYNEVAAVLEEAGLDPQAQAGWKIEDDGRVVEAPKQPTTAGAAGRPSVQGKLAAG